MKRETMAADASAAGLTSGLLAVLMWGLAPVATRAVVGELTALPLAVLRTLIAAVVLLPWCRPLLRNLDRATALRLAGAGVLGLIGYPLPVALGLQWLPASTAALILATEPVWILALGRIWHGTPVAGWAWGGSAIALAGVAVLAAPAGSATGRTLAGIGLVLLGAVLFAAYTIALRPLSLALGPQAATAGSTVAAAVPYLAVAWLIPLPRLTGLPPSGWAELAFLALGSTVAGMLLWNVAVARTGSTRAGLLLFLEPLVGVTGGVALLGERLSVAGALGGVLVLLGVVVAWLAQRRLGRPGRPGQSADPGAAAAASASVRAP